MIVRRTPTVTAYALVALGMGHVGFEIARAPSWTVDDAWITARYASNLVRHGVFSFNVEGPHVEGITSLLYGLFAAIFLRLGISPIGGLTAISITALLCSGMLVFRIARAMRVEPHVSALLAWMWLAIPEHITHATSGLETEVFLALSFACIDGFLLTWNKPRAKLFPIACALICFCRPEGFAITCVLFALLVYRVYRHRRHLRELQSTALCILVPALLLLAFRQIYFGSLLPNTFYAKSRGAPSVEVFRDLLDLAEANSADFVVVAVAVLVVALLLAKKRSLRRIGPRSLWLVLASVIMLGVFLATYRHKDVMNYSRRFAMHAFPWLYILSLAIVAKVTRTVRHLSLPRARMFGIVSAGAALAILFWLPARMRTHADEIQKMSDHAFVRQHWYVPALQAIRHSAPDAKVLAVIPDAGFLPYHTDLQTIDFGRLNDRYLAREARTSSDVVEYFFRSEADVVVFSHYGEERLFNADAKALIIDPRFSSSYERIAEFRDARAHGISVYAHRRLTR